MAEELDINDIPVEEEPSTEDPVVPGTPITAQEVYKRLSDKLGRQLSDGSDTFVLDAVKRAEIYVMAIISRFGLAYNLDDHTMREITLVNTIAELHLALGNIEGGKELRLKAKDLVLAAYGDYPDTDSASESEGKQVGSVGKTRPDRTFEGY